MSDRYHQPKNNKNHGQKQVQKPAEKNDSQQTPITQPTQPDPIVTVTMDKSVKQFQLGTTKTENVLFTEKKTEVIEPTMIKMNTYHTEPVESQQQVPTQTSVEVKQRDKKNLAFSSAKTVSVIQTKAVKEQIEKKEIKQEPVVYIPKPQLSEWQNNMFASIAKILRPSSSDALMTNINSAARIYAKQETVESNVLNEDKELKNIYDQLCVEKNDKQNDIINLRTHTLEPKAVNVFTKQQLIDQLTETIQITDRTSIDDQKKILGTTVGKLEE
ncbi:Hypothetical_protein [Hexamita inflata]|uniref:Hypothetical_protein n=1 Tax=Hexamita inflata TaxID=28002 RepID=A0AA86N6V9_9EUKA|nr:Hypothetical protein HINF_LOCUS1642 [Hexamita inflata]